MKNILKVWLKRFVLNNPDDYSAMVSSAGSIGKQGLIDALMAEGVELKRETLEDVISRYNRICAAYALGGWNVDTGLVYMRPVVTGTFRHRNFDPERNRIYVAVTQGAAIRREAANTQVHILGDMPDAMYITRITNMQTRAADGTLSRGFTAVVEGAYLKVVGADPAVGVYLCSAETGAQAKLEPAFLITNVPTKLMIQVPHDLPTGAYLLKVVTQFSGGNYLLKSPRETVFHQELTML